MKTYFSRGYFLLLVIAAGQFACSVANNAQTYTSNNRNTVAAIEKPAARKVSEDTPDSGQKKNYLGCWTDGRNMALRITEDQIMISPDFIPVSYREEKAGPENNSVLLHIDRPKGNYFQEYALVRFVENKFGPMMNISSYSSYQEFLDDKEVGGSGWTKDDCSKSFFQPGKQSEVK